MRTPLTRFAAVALALALFATACGGAASESATSAGPAEVTEAESVDDSATEAAAAAAETNIELLAGGTTAFDYEVLNVHDGSISSVDEVVDGDRAVLLWFFSPH